jgi:YidC/Oxa1 family membrane protein insertase
VLNSLYNFIARATVVIHSGLKHVTGDNGYTWGLSIILLVMAVRLVLVPLFVKQIKSQRQMQLMQPKIKELRDKYKNDKQKMNEEMIKLQREHGNPLLGCLPTVLQIPLFLALYRVMNGFEPQIKSTPIPGSINGYYPKHLSGLSVDQASQIAHAKIFGASLAGTIRSSHQVLNLLGASVVGTQVVCIALIIIMMVSTYVTQRQIMGRSAPAEGQQAATQKILLYVSPLFLGIFGLRISVGGLLYWFTTNLWSMAQQFVVIRRMPPVIPAGGAPATAAAAVVKPPSGGGLLGGRRKEPPPPAPEPQRRLIQQRATSDGPAMGPAASDGRPPRGGSASKRKKSRKGGRR